MDHMALFLPTEAFRPYIKGAVRGCNVKELSAKGRDEKNKLLQEALTVDREPSIAFCLKRDSHPSDTYHMLARNVRIIIKNALNEQKKFTGIDTT